ncbi:MAG: DUF1778 domain-containing protein [Rhizobiaceae bacterium]|nr:DUF1778 domain-containing protein [Rhizobiaceae bacterium]
MTRPARTEPARTEKLDLRLSAASKRKLAAAATAERRTVSDFVLASALDRADEALAGRRDFQLDAAAWQDLLAALDAPPRDLPELRKLLREPGLFSAGRQK